MKSNRLAGARSPLRTRVALARLCVALAGLMSACAADETPSEEGNGGSAGSGVAGASSGASSGGRAGGTASTGGTAGGNTAGAGGTNQNNGGTAGSSSNAGAGTSNAGGGNAGGNAAGMSGSANAAGNAGSANGGNAGAAGGGAGQNGAAGASSAGMGGGGALGPVTVFIAGDSTVSTYRDTASDSDQAGWGQMIGGLFDDRVTIENRAVGGMTARHFIENGYLDEIFEDIAAGDYLLVQFGTNDGNRTATYELNGETIPYYLDPATDFKTYLEEYVTGARERGATPVFVTPPPRNSAYCTGGNGTGAHATAMRELGMAENVAVSDLNAKSVAYLEAICPAPTPENFFLVRADGSVDGTHFQEHGARVLASLVAEGIQEAELPLAGYLKP